MDLQIHMTIIGLDSPEQFMIVAYIDENLRILLYSLKEEREGTGFEVGGVFCSHYSYK